MMSRIGKRGFSLIEMIVVLGIIVIVVGMSLPYFGRYTSGSKLKQVTRRISSLLHTARSYAITYRKEYSVDFQVEKNKVLLLKEENLERVDKEYRIPSPVKIDHPSGEDPVTFKGDRVVFKPTGGLSGQTGEIWLVDKKGNRVKITVFQSTGRIKVELDKFDPVE